MVNHKNLGKNILELVKVFPEVKDNYNTLVFYYWTIFDDSSTLQDIKNSTSPESITRAYRKLVEYGLIDVPVKVKEKRAEAEKAYQNDFASL